MRLFLYERESILALIDEQRQPTQSSNPSIDSSLHLGTFFLLYAGERQPNSIQIMLPAKFSKFLRGNAIVAPYNPNEITDMAVERTVKG